MYKEFDSVEALNKEAEELLKAGNEKEIINLAINQGIDKDEAQDYIDGIVDTFATANMAAMLEINFQNARCTEDTNKNKYVNKKKSGDKVDQVVGNINSTYLIEQELLYGTSEYFVQMI